MKESAFVTSNEEFIDEKRRADIMRILEKLQTLHYENGTMILKNAYDGYGNEEAADDIMDIFVVSL